MLNPKTLYYHGAKTPQPKSNRLHFDNQALYTANAHGQDDGYGFYLTTSQPRAASYGPYVWVCQFDQTRQNLELATDICTLPRQVVAALVKATDAQSNYAATAGASAQDQAVDSLFLYNISDVSLIHDLLYQTSNPETIMRTLSAFNYTYALSDAHPGDLICYAPDRLNFIKA